MPAEPTESTATAAAAEPAAFTDPAVATEAALAAEAAAPPPATVPSFQVTFDAANPRALGTFWGAVLGYVEQPPPDGYESWDDFLDSIDVPHDERDSMYSVVDPGGSRPRLLFQRVPEGKTAKNRVHLDVNCGGGRTVPIEQRRPRLEDEAQRLVGLGGTRLGTGEEPGGFWVRMQDPEGNEFCIQ